MSLKDDFNRLAHNLITDTFKSIAQQLSFKETKGLYDEESGEVIDFAFQGIALDAIVGPFQDIKNEIDDIQVGDLRAVISTKSIADNNIKMFLQSDSFMLGTDVYTAISIIKDPSESVYILQLRKQ